MAIFFTLLSILAIAGIASLWNRLAPRHLCPICTSIAGTWIWILAGSWIGFLGGGDWRLIAALLMGGSVVGIAYQLEKRRAETLSLGWKIVFIPAGFLAAYGLIEEEWPLALAGLVVTVLMAMVAGSRGRGSASSQHRVKNLEEKLKSCC